MITTALINSAYYVLGFFIAIFPISQGFPSEVAQAFTYIGGYAGMLDPLVPLDTLATTVGIVLSIELLILTFRMLEWIFSKLPIVGK